MPADRPVAPRPPLPPGPYLVAGLGRAGTAAARTLAARADAARIAVWDGLARPHERAAAAALEEELGIVTQHLGVPGDLLDRTPPPRTLVKSPGLSFDTPLVREAWERGLAVLDEFELGWRLDRRPLFAVTGTNGKSTTASLMAAVLQEDGRAPVLAGNTRFGVPMSCAPDEPGETIVAELSSFQLEGCPALLPEAAVFTNLTQDHEYRHRTADAYARCKRTLFIRGTDAVPAAAIGIDQPFGRTLAGDLRALGSTVTTFGQHPHADLRLEAVTGGRGGSRLLVRTPHGERTIDTRLTGSHNALNVLAALAFAELIQVDPEVAVAAVGGTDPLPGRFEWLPAPAGFDVVVDYAHNPDGVVQALAAARAILDDRGHGALRAVVSTLSMVGPEQAAAVGRAAAAQADHVYLTTQRWTLDDPADDVTPGLREGGEDAPRATVVVEPDREAAIALALAGAEAGDLVLVLDRGELAGPLYDREDRAVAFDDRQTVRSLLEA